MMRRFCIALLLSILPVNLSIAKVGEKEQIVKGDLESNLKLLKFWSSPDEKTLKLYRLAYEILAGGKLVSFADLAENKDFQQFCIENNIRHLGGPMLGDISSDSVKVWMRTVRPAEIKVVVEIDGNEKTFGPIKSSAETDMSAIVNVTGLKPMSRYDYKVLVDDQAISTASDAAITTGPVSTIKSKVKIAFGTCSHRWGLGNSKLFELIKRRGPTAMLLYGDIAVQDRDDHLGFHRCDYLLRDFFPAWQNFSASVPVYAVWDDHDYFNDDKAGIPDGYKEKDKHGVWDVFRYAWNNPSYGFGDDKKGVFLRTRIGPCDVILLDGRYFRTGEEGSFLGCEQMEWLKNQLTNCKGPFIILACPTMWTDHVSNGKDSWGRWDPDGREDLFRFIEKNHISGVLLLSGDRHGARGFTIPRESGFKFYEFETACLGARTGPKVTKPEWKNQLYGIAGEYAFGEFTVDGSLADPEVTFRLIREDEKEIYKITLRKSELTPGKK